MTAKRRPAAESSVLPSAYAPLLSELKARVRHAQVRAALAANAEMLQLYWHIGHAIARQQEAEGWGKKIIPRLAADLSAEFPEMKGFSERNIGRMVAFHREYPDLFRISPTPLAKLEAPEISPTGLAKLSGAIVQQSAAQITADDGLLRLAAKIPWAFHVLLMEKTKDRPTRFWYMQRTLEQGWSHAVLRAQIAAKAHRGAGTAITNFSTTLPPVQSDLAQQALKDPYVFDFLTLATAARERDLEQGLIDHIQKFLVTLGVGFAFVGRQVHLAIGGQDYYLDLLFYHLKLRCFVVIDLKVEAFKPEFAGKMNFYLSAVDAQLRHPDDQPTIGLLLCQENNRITVEYALRDVKKPIGVAQWKTKLVDSLPKNLRGALPTIEQLEKELAQN
jgi:predicted nuclease of restriction endonuclease-like (RecB) superfamily